jgi:hypothetical protein
VKSRAELPDGQKADINKPIKQKVDMTKSNPEQKADMQKADMPKSRYTKS